MVNLISTLAVSAATLATLSQGASFFLVTSRVTKAGQPTGTDDWLFIFDSSSAALCGAAASNGQCSTPPKGSNASACTANYSGANAWVDGSGLFYNRNSATVNDGALRILTKAGPSFGFNVTTDRACAKYSCTGNAAGYTTTYTGYKCTN